MPDIDRVSLTRRTLLRRAGLGLAALALPGVAGARVAAFSRQRVIIVGGGVGGAEFSRLLAARADIEVTVFDPRTSVTALPSTSPLAAERGLQPRRIHSHHIARAVIDIDPVAHVVIDSEGERHGYDRLVLSPGIGFVAGEFDAGIAAWTPGSQSLELDRAINAMPAGGTIAITVPERPYRFTEGPYLRAARIARWVTTHKPGSNIVLLDANPTPEGPVMDLAATLNSIPGIEWRQGGRIDAINAGAGGHRIETGDGMVTAAVLNHIPRQRAADLAVRAGLTDANGWCPRNARTLESALVEDVLILGDAARSGGKHGRDAFTDATTAAWALT